jgi:hypothetical protein
MRVNFLNWANLAINTLRRPGDAQIQNKIENYELPEQEQQEDLFGIEQRGTFSS